MADTGTAPRVSVIMPAYNCENYILPAIRSVQAQTIEDWELIVIDDCSQDGTCRILRELADADPRIRFLQNEHNLGAAGTRNKGLDLCRGEYAALLDSDDIWHSEKLEKQLSLAQETGADIIYSSYALIDEFGKQKCDDFLVPPQTDFKAMLAKSVIGCSTVMLSRQVVDHYRFSTEYYHEDFALWLQLLRDGKRAAGVTEVLVDYRVLQNSRASNKLACAKRRWAIYRGMLGMSCRESAFYLVQYAFAGVRKYRTRRSK